MDGINTIWQILCFSKAVFIADEIITLGIFGGVVAARRFQKYLKFGSGLRRFKAGVAVIGVLNQGNSAFDDLFAYIACDGVVFHGVVFGFGADVVDGFIK